MTNHATIDNPPARAETRGDAAPFPGRPRYDDINTPVIVLIGVISTLVTLVTIWAIEGLYYQWSSQMIRERNFDVTNPRQVDEINAQKAKLLGDPDRDFEPLQAVIPDVIARYRIEPEDGGDAGSGGEGGAAGDGDASDAANEDGEPPGGAGN